MQSSVHSIHYEHRKVLEPGPQGTRCVAAALESFKHKQRTIGPFALTRIFACPSACLAYFLEVIPGDDTHKTYIILKELELLIRFLVRKVGVRGVHAGPRGRSSSSQTHLLAIWGALWPSCDRNAASPRLKNRLEAFPALHKLSGFLATSICRTILLVLQ